MKYSKHLLVKIDNQEVISRLFQWYSDKPETLATVGLLLKDDLDTAFVTAGQHKFEARVTDSVNQSESVYVCIETSVSISSSLSDIVFLPLVAHGNKLSALLGLETETPETGKTETVETGSTATTKSSNDDEKTDPTNKSKKSRKSSKNQ